LLTCDCDNTDNTLYRRVYVRVHLFGQSKIYLRQLVFCN